MSKFKLILLTALFLVFFDNFSFFKHVISIYPVSIQNITFLISLVIFLTTVITIVFTLLCWKHTTKPALITILIASSIASYFMNNYNIVIDDIMIQTIFETNLKETLDLFSFKLLVHLTLTGILPSILIYKTKIKYKSIIKELSSGMMILFGALLILIAITFAQSDFYFSFFREHKPLRYYTNPTYFLYAVGKHINNKINNEEIGLTPIGTDANIPETDKDRELIILVVGEAARADRFSLNGYSRETNPLLKKEDIINFTNMHSCGTLTAVSVPCMFSVFSRDEYSEKKARSHYNIIDVLHNAGVNILWRDNNSSSKGVALRVPYEDFRTPENNPICDIECRDEGMLVGLQEYIDSKENGDILIVLHQMGNHGPAYYKRYPKSFEKFKPVCKTNQLEKCSNEEISNAYDNAILYTDYFLSKVIALLKNNPEFETAMFYLSDHGESLGENNIYLHGMPYFIAPETQTHIPAIIWFGDGFKIDKKAIEKRSDNKYSQDNLFHTLLGLMEIDTEIYDEKMDITHIQ
jgi:lipid A ethanolaminephosphotransferase